jgi:hypothetical protein
MNVNNNYAKAYVEVLEILRYLPKDEYEKIPKTKIQYYIENCDKNYHFDFDVSKPLNEQQFLRETNTIIVTLFRDYFATSNQKETLQKILLSNEEKRQEKLREQYNTDNLFKKHEKLEKDECMDLVEVKEENRLKEIFQKIINWIKQLNNK